MLLLLLHACDEDKPHLLQLPLLAPHEAGVLDVDLRGLLLRQGQRLRAALPVRLQQPAGTPNSGYARLLPALQGVCTHRSSGISVT